MHIKYIQDVNDAIRIELDIDGRRIEIHVERARVKINIDEFFRRAASEESIHQDEHVSVVVE